MVYLVVYLQPTKYPRTTPDWLLQYKKKDPNWIKGFARREKSTSELIRAIITTRVPNFSIQAPPVSVKRKTKLPQSVKRKTKLPESVEAETVGVFLETEDSHSVKEIIERTVERSGRKTKEVIEKTVDREEVFGPIYKEDEKKIETTTRLKGWQLRSSYSNSVLKEYFPGIYSNTLGVSYYSISDEI